MSVPKKRKKLDEESVTQVQSEALENPESSTKVKKTSSSRLAKPRSEKVEQAFEVVDKIEQKEPVQAIEVKRFHPPAEQGIHVRFKVDIITIEDILNLGNQKEKKENSIVFDFTIPYVWNLPIINEVTKTIIQELKKMRIIQ